jgi:hypothetical protein
MSSEPMSLAQIQREMAAAIMRPLTPDEDMQVRAIDGRPMTAVAESFIAPNSSLTAFERLEIYNRQYWYRVLDALVEDFPALRAVVGGRAFDAMSVAYLSHHPSRSFTMRDLGCKLAEWLPDHPKFAGRRQRLALDVVRIEWALVEAFDSAEHTPLTLDQIATLDAGSRLSLQPNVQLLALDYEADDIVLALHDRQKRETSEAGQKHENGPPAPAKLPKLRRKRTWVAAHRVDLSVYYRRLEEEEFLTLGAIRQGLPLAEALEAGFQNSHVSAEKRPPRVRQWFANWTEFGWICAPDLESLLET